MPELPEVETVRRGLAPRLVGHRIVRLIQRRRDLRVPLPAKFAQKVEGRTVQAIDRRAKYLLIRLDDGDGILMYGNLAEAEPADIEPDMPVEVVFTDIADDFTLPVWRRTEA